MKNSKKLIILTLIFLLMTTLLAAKKKKQGLLNSSHIQSIHPGNFAQIWLQPMVKNLINSTRLSSAVIWALDASKLSGQLVNMVHCQISKYLPTLQLDKIQMDMNGDDRSVELPIIIRPRKTLNVILLHSESPDSLNRKIVRHLSWITRKSLNWPRSKTLAIIMGNEKRPIVSQTVEKMLKSAWADKFVDFSIIHVHKNLCLPPEVSYYQTFDQVIKIQKLQACETIFPQKLKNLKGHQFIIDLDEKRFDWEEKKMKSFNWVFLTSLYPTDYVFAKYFFCHFRNCTMVAKPEKAQTPDMMYGFQRIDYKNLKGYASDSCYRFLTIWPAIPHHNKSTTTLSYDNLLFAYSLFVIILLVLKLTMVIFRLDGRNWNVMKMYSCILGYSVPVDHSGFKNRVFYLSLVFWSFYVSNGLLELATEFELETTTESIDNLDQLLLLRLPIFSNYRLNRLLNDDKLGDNFIYTFENKSTIYDCFTNMSVKNDRICIGNNYVFNLASSRNIKAAGKGFRRAAFNLVQACETNLFKAGLAYADEYYKFVLRSLDHGILRRLTLRQECIFKKIDYSMQDYDVVSNDPSAFYYSLFAVTLFCYALAVIIFFREIVTDKLHTKRLRRRNK